MCGIVGAIAQRNVSAILMEGLKRLEYRGYDSAGIAIIDKKNNNINCLKALGKVEKLQNALSNTELSGGVGIAHTRWATHGEPSELNSHPHISADNIALVHNGIIENYAEIKKELMEQGYKFITETDTETIAHLIHRNNCKEGATFIEAVKEAIDKVTGAYGLAVVNKDFPDRVVVARSGSPLVVGVGIGENFIASDPIALGQVTDRFIYLEEGDIAEISLENITIWNKGEIIERPILRLKQEIDDVDKGQYRHFMLKEIFEQEKAIRNTLDGRVSKKQVLEEAFGIGAKEIFDKVKNVQIVACGTSFHAGQIAKYWLENLAGLTCQVDIASDYRYRNIVVQEDSLLITISQSGETADTLAALRYSKSLNYIANLAICNVANSSIVRESDICLLTQAGREIGVASTKAFTTQLTVLLLFSIVLARRKGLAESSEHALVEDINQLPARVAKTLKLDPIVRFTSEAFAEKHHALFLGRGIQYPVAKEGALKLKEISYIHAEAYPAGELKHGPLALVDSDMPIIAVAPNNELLGKLKANLEEVSARGGVLFVFADESAGFSNDKNCTVINVPAVSDILAPIIYTIPLQLLSYHIAVLKGTDVDHPRNLAKSVTVE